MASDIVTAKADPAGRTEDEAPDGAAGRRRVKRFGGSRLGGLILALNLLSLLILFGGALLLNELRQGLVTDRQVALTSQAELLVRVLGEPAVGVTRGDPMPYLDQVEAGRWLTDRFIPAGQRARLFDVDGLAVADSAPGLPLQPIADSYVLTEAIPGQPLPPARPAGSPEVDQSDQTAREVADLTRANAELTAEVTRALDGEPQASVRYAEDGRRVISVSVPVRHVSQVLGVLTLEAGDVDEILGAQRRALTPFALVALLVNLLASLLLHLFVARPVMRLSAAADEVKQGRARAISLPDMEGRKDEIGDLARSLESMTETLSDRMDAIERFAADVSHEIKNPLTSIRSALETLDLVKDKSQRDRLTALLQADVRRLDRLITDISNASRLDAELSRDRPRPIDLNALISDIVEVYRTTGKPGDAGVQLTPVPGEARVLGRDGPLGQVFRNLIDNARSFSPPGGLVRVSLQRNEADPARGLSVVVEDDGPGIPADNLETVFERFYTSRPKGTAFGANSGLGLSIVRQIVEAHGGRVQAENRSDPDGTVRGARFRVDLPATPVAVVRRT